MCSSDKYSDSCSDNSPPSNDILTVNIWISAHTRSMILWMIWSSCCDRVIWSLSGLRPNTPDYMLRSKPEIREKSGRVSFARKVLWSPSLQIWEVGPYFCDLIKAARQWELITWSVPTSRTRKPRVNLLEDYVSRNCHFSIEFNFAYSF